MVSVFENKERKLHTTRSWGFLGVDSDRGIPQNSIWKAARFGKDTIIGNLDTGLRFFPFLFYFCYLLAGDLAITYIVKVSGQSPRASTMQGMALFLQGGGELVKAAPNFDATGS